MADGTRGNEAGLDESKEQLVKTSRMYAMCQLAEVENPLDVTGLALAAFQDMPSGKHSCSCGRTNRT